MSLALGPWRVAPASAQTSAPAIAFGTNLIVNGNAEADTGAGDAIVTLSSCTSSGKSCSSILSQNEPDTTKS